MPASYPPAPVGVMLAQQRVSVTTAFALFTAVHRTEITRISICNTSKQGQNFSVFHDDTGLTFDESTALQFDQTLAGATTLIFESPIGSGVTLSPGGSLGFQVATADVITVTIYGVV